jgi:hypothetical protein
MGQDEERPTTFFSVDSWWILVGWNVPRLEVFEKIGWSRSKTREGRKK